MSTREKREQNTLPAQAKGRGCGIPTLAFIRKTEKLDVVCPVKLFPSLKNWVKQRGGSAFVKSLIEKAKQHEEDKGKR